MKILVISNLPPWAPGGAETQALKLSREWKRMGHEVVVAGQLLPDRTMEVDGATIELRHIPFINWSRPLRALSYVAGLGWFILRHHRQFDIVYCRFVREAAVVLSLLKHYLGLRFRLVACSACALHTGCAQFLLDLPLSGKIIAALDSAADAINNISAKTGEELAAIGLDDSKFTYIGNGTELPPEVRRFDSGAPLRLVCVSRLAFNKGHRTLLDALAELQRGGTAIDMTLIGDGPERAALQARTAELGLEDVVHFRGFVDNRELFPALLEYDVFVLPSDSEGFATVVIEAMACGLPVVVTRSGGPEYFVDDQVGRTCRTRNSADLAQAIRAVLQLPPGELARLGRNGRQRVREHFEISRVAERYIALFEGILGGERIGEQPVVFDDRRG
ncbi:MAG: glycosyltransferase family 4 protein [Gammaproteobacteria bacterium]|jgi:glycosyltransferase involved in cell wall biosynthesis|nr:glycosyltransferase family 4 protein [Gammaproteobacteria bacterium]